MATPINSLAMPSWIVTRTFTAEDGAVHTVPVQAYTYDVNAYKEAFSRQCAALARNQSVVQWYSGQIDDAVLHAFHLDDEHFAEYWPEFSAQTKKMVDAMHLVGVHVDYYAVTKVALFTEYFPGNMEKSEMDALEYEAFVGTHEDPNADYDGDKENYPSLG